MPEEISDDVLWIICCFTVDACEYLSIQRMLEDAWEQAWTPVV